MTASPISARLRKDKLVEDGGLSVLDVQCVAPEPAWSEQEWNPLYGLIFPRSGVFLRRTGGREMLLDPGVAYFERPDVPEQVAHPSGASNVCTAIKLSEEVVAGLLGGDTRVPVTPVFTDGGVDLAQRTLVARLRAGTWTEFEAAEQAIRLAANVLEQWRPEQVRRGRPSTAKARQRLVDQARELLAADPSTIKLSMLASMLCVSPHHLSRVFHEETGHTLARYRNRLRVRLALERIEDGERNLAGLAFDLGFADHAHLTRTVRREIGCPPAHLYALLQQPV